MNEIRLLRPDEIFAKVKTIVHGDGALLLLYKDARVDMTILDETFGARNWQRHHKEIKGHMFCTISVYDPEKKCWVEKEDVGIESYTEAEKGESSDSFKRAGTNWGIGRELYTSPKIIVRLNRNEFNGKKVYTTIYVSDIGYNERREISKLEHKDGNGVVRFSWDSGKPKGTAEEPEQPFDIEAYRVDVEAMLMDSTLPKERLDKALKGLPNYDKKILDATVKMLEGLKNG